jgi:hypothetical protein
MVFVNLGYLGLKSFLNQFLKTSAMNKVKFLSSMILLLIIGVAGTAKSGNDEKLNLPGDNLNLYAVLNLFQQSETLEGFEKDLNAEDSKINNLDLNGDDQIDYIKVVDNVDGDVHTIVLQVAISKMENQDVAVFTVQRDSKNQVQIQLIGDEELYGKDYIIEPIYSDVVANETPNPGYVGNTTTVQKETIVVNKTTYVEVASWPVITYIYVPTYTVYRSPWYWGYYPAYWNPWRPYYYDYYYGYHYNYHNHYYGHYHHSHYNRYPHYHDHYYNGHRSYSNKVNQRRESGMYKNTYSRPETRQQGTADFNKKYPNGYRPTERPGNTNNNARPATKPTTPTNGSRPATKPSTNSNGARPTTKPGTTGSGARPSAKPGSTNNNTRPSVKPATNDKQTRPASPQGNNSNSTRPATTKPYSRPNPITPAIKSDVNKIISRPENKPNSKPRPSTAPSTKPNASPTNRLTKTPASKPAVNQSKTENPSKR